MTDAHCASRVRPYRCEVVVGARYLAGGAGVVILHMATVRAAIFLIVKPASRTISDASIVARDVTVVVALAASTAASVATLLLKRGRGWAHWHGFPRVLHPTAAVPVVAAAVVVVALIVASSTAAAVVVVVLLLLLLLLLGGHHVGHHLLVHLLLHFHYRGVTGGVLVDTLLCLLLFALQRLLVFAYCVYVHVERPHVETVSHVACCGLLHPLDVRVLLERFGVLVGFVVLIALAPFLQPVTVYSHAGDLEHERVHQLLFRKGVVCEIGKNNAMLDLRNQRINS